MNIIQEHCCFLNIKMLNININKIPTFSTKAGLCLRHMDSVSPSFKLCKDPSLYSKAVESILNRTLRKLLNLTSK